jgi:Domain of unknown function (DUF1918)
MHASVGAHIVVHGAHVGQPDRAGEILEIRGADGQPPYVVRWSESGQEALYFPGPDAHIDEPAAG